MADRRFALINHSHAGSGSTTGVTLELSDLTDVNTSTATARNVLVADGVDWESRALTELDISDLGSYSVVGHTHVEADITDLQAYLTAEVNDLSAAVTWANIPDANVPESAVTQHQAALSITESQISDLQPYLLFESDTLATVLARGTTATSNMTLTGNFNATTIGGITEGNLVDKSVNETITGDWTFNGTTTLVGTLNITGDINATGDVSGATIGGITEANLLDKSAAETVSGGQWTFANTTNNTSGGFRTNNAVYFRSKEVGGTTRSLIGINASDEVIVGTSVLPARIQATAIGLEAVATLSGGNSVRADAALQISSTSHAGIYMQSTTGTADENNWSIDALSSTSQFRISTSSDADGFGEAGLTINRTGTAIDSVDLFNEARVRTGAALTIWDSTNTDKADFSHDGTDFNTAFTNTTDWNITGITSINVTGGVTFSADILAASGLSVQGTATDQGQVGQIAFVDITSGVARFGSYNWDTASWQPAGMYGSTLTFRIGSTELMGLTSGAVDVKGDLTLSKSTPIINMTETATGTTGQILKVDTTGQFLLRPTSGVYDDDLIWTSGTGWQFDKDCSVINTLYVKNAGVTDWAEFSHNGTDFYTDFVNTTWWRVNADATLTGILNLQGAESRWYSSGNSAYIRIGCDSTTSATINASAAVGNLNIDGMDQVVVGSPILIEESAAAVADQATYGQIWVKNTTPNELWFTDDAGTDFHLNTAQDTAVNSQLKVLDTTTSRTATTTLADQTQLSGFEVLAATFYSFEAVLFMTTYTVPDFKFALQHSNAPALCVYSYNTVDSTGDTEGVGYGTGSNVETVIVDTDGTGTIIRISGVLKGHATLDSVMDFQWAQNTSSGSATTLYGGSWIRIERTV